MVYDKIIEGLTVNLRAVEVDDAEITFSMRSDSEKTKYMHPAYGTVENQMEYIKKQREKDGDYLFVVTDKEGKIIGMRGIYDVSNDHAESGRTIGYGDAFQNMEALILGLDFAFDILGVNKIFMDAAVDNQSVRGIQIQLGAKEYKRDRLPGLEYEYVFSVLDKADYINTKEKIMRLIEMHVQRKGKK